MYVFVCVHGGLLKLYKRIDRSLSDDIISSPDQS